jgi:hypothetical protein
VAQGTYADQGGQLKVFITLQKAHPMKLLIWSSFVLLTFLWTAFAAIAVNVSDWVMGLLANGGSLADPVAALNLPAWLALWVPAEMVTAIQGTITGTWTWLEPWLPGASTLGSIMSFLIWLSWGVGAVILLGLAIAGHWFVTRRLR